MPKSTFVYVTYIRTTPERLWSALTDDTEFMKQYWFGSHCESQWTTGSSWKLMHPDGSIADSGEIAEAVAPRRLVIRWQNQNKPELNAEGASLWLRRRRRTSPPPGLRRAGNRGCVRSSSM